jgi:LCP family protein required for cell wall assembly
VKRGVRSTFVFVITIAVSFLLPGVVLLKRRFFTGASVLVLSGCVVVLSWPALSDPAVALVDSTALLQLCLGALGWVLLGVVSALVAFEARRVMQVFAAGVMLLPVGLGAWVVVPQWRMTEQVFVSAPVAEPSSEVRMGATTTTGPVRTERFNVLLLGGDAGPGRWGLRTDAMHLVSVDPSGGEIVVVSVPRNLPRAPMPGAIAEKFPKGFTNIANAVFGWGEANADEVREALGPTDAPGASLTAAMVAELTGVRVDAWVLTDMAGFIELIDAAGGVRVWVEEKIKAPGSVPSGKHPVADFEAGWHEMDGTDALAFARARTQDSDYHRMARQRCVLASLADQVEPEELVLRWPQLTAAIAANIRTNLAPRDVNWLRGMAGLGSDRVKVLSLDPGTITRRWVLEDVRALVRDALGEGEQATPVTQVPVGGVVPSTTPVAPVSVSGDERWGCRTS